MVSRKSQTIILRAGAVALIAALGLVGSPVPAPALGSAGPGPSSPAPAAPEFTLTVSPTRLVIDPGQVNDEQHFRVSNQGARPVDVEVSKRNFASGANGAMVLQADAPYSASNWVTVSPERFHLDAGATAAVSARIAVPKDPESGDHQVALVFVVLAGPEKTNIKVNRGIGVPVFIAVPGPIDRTAEVADLRAPRFLLRGPVDFTATVRAIGTVHRDFRDSQRLAVHVDGRDVRFPDFTVMRGTGREVAAQWTDPPLWCVCTATVSLTRADGTIQQAAVRVVILPLHLLAIGAAVIVALLFVMGFVRRRYRQRTASDDVAGVSASADPP